MSLASVSGATNNGGLWLKESGSSRVYLYCASNDGHGVLALTNGSGSTTVYLDGSDGTKSFVTEHPNDENKSIVYACLEGPEAAAYTRGTIDLVNGEVWVSFEEHFSLIINSNTMTVQITPLSAESNGLAVTEKNQNGFRIKELNNGKGNYKVDYFVQAVRKGHEDFQPVRNKSEMEIYNLEEPPKEQKE